MKRIALFAVCLGLLLFVAGCAGAALAPVVPPYGMAYNNTKAPLDVDYDPTTVTTKQGEASTQNILGLVAWGDASTEAAARQGGLQKVHHADYRALNVLGIYGKYTTIVYGE